MFSVWIGIFLMMTQTAWPKALPPEFINLKNLPHVVVDLRYASTNNFMSKNVYGDFKETFLHKKAYRMLENASLALQKKMPGAKLIVFDALRPRHVQRILFAYVKGTPQEKYVGNPDRGSMHNYGLAVDLSILDPDGNELDMGTPYDDFSDLAQPQLEKKFLQSGELTETQVTHRKLLREVMEAQGFKVLRHEWWHFDALPQDEVRRLYTIVE